MEEFFDHSPLHCEHPLGDLYRHDQHLSRTNDGNRDEHTGEVNPTARQSQQCILTQLGRVLDRRASITETVVVFDTALSRVVLHG